MGLRVSNLSPEIPRFLFAAAPLVTTLDKGNHFVDTGKIPCPFGAGSGLSHRGHSRQNQERRAAETGHEDSEGKHLTSREVEKPIDAAKGQPQGSPQPLPGGFYRHSMLRAYAAFFCAWSRVARGQFLRLARST